MTFKTGLTTFATLCALTLAAPSWAQETTTQPTTTDAAQPTDPAQLPVGATYIRETHTDWAIQCLKTGQDQDACTMFQLVKGEENNIPLAEVNVNPLTDAGGAVAGINMLVPLGALLTAGAALDVDNANMRQYPYVVCAPEGCLVRAGLSQDDFNRFKNGAEARIHIVNAADPTKPVRGKLSLLGFTAAYNALSQ